MIEDGNIHHDIIYTTAVCINTLIEQSPHKFNDTSEYTPIKQSNFKHKLNLLHEHNIEHDKSKYEHWRIT